MQHFRFDMQRNVSHTWSKTLELQNHVASNIYLQYIQYKSRSVPADEFGSSAACILISNTFQPYVLHKYGKDPIIACRSQSGHDTKHLRSLLHQRYNCQKKGESQSKKGTKTKIVFPFGLPRPSHPKSLSLRYNMYYAAVEF